MAGRKRGKWLAGLLAGLVATGCSGILMEKQFDDGQLERIRVEGGESWKVYDRNPLKGDTGTIILKKESTF